jgi:F0F1-type ATP synthase beta subunit
MLKVTGLGGKIGLFGGAGVGKTVLVQELSSAEIEDQTEMRSKRRNRE